ncbi:MULTISPECIES: hypothetical protein [unclassified Streptomyces]|uniref:hypothetical protein n=1 Tax=unclassified Streptomyces TaxID=2593676 RepID=UPI00225B6620|nr:MULTISPECIES: hypothetical protein [unclassified Streptomyces]MCX5443649.1 hypothetical protein [Streptomyces sp. NBC_00063]WSE12032.1 hypothetical protein OG518_01075 [Streptomyces sp. NBC_01397]WSE19594.1 hypothetical protein OG518_43365 [Streptomyces sp. NBC_01397]WUB99035.1 hypothetical protein OHO83_45870 [Streptomyces sp. NBC_00569]
MTAWQTTTWGARVSATPAVHRQLLAHCQSLDGTPGTSAIPAPRKARREYGNRLNTLVADHQR